MMIRSSSSSILVAVEAFQFLWRLGPPWGVSNERGLLCGHIRSSKYGKKLLLLLLRLGELQCCF